MTLYLASQSPRRRELLSQLGVPFEVFSVDLDEKMYEREAPEDFVRRMAHEKGVAARARVGEGDVVLTADTIVVLEGRVFGKPVNEDAAHAMLRTLSGRTHTVYTAVSVSSGASNEGALCESRVTIAELSERVIDQYVASGDPMDKAGSYGIQGPAGAFIERIEGSYWGVMGLPLFRTAQLLKLYGMGPLC